eukprot:1137188-Pelagomonas_calceolata.AAC.4
MQQKFPAPPASQPAAPDAVDAGSRSGGKGEEEGGEEEGEGEGRAGAERQGRLRDAKTKQLGINAVIQTAKHFTFVGHGMLKCISCSWLSSSH